MIALTNVFIYFAQSSMHSDYSTDHFLVEVNEISTKFVATSRYIGTWYKCFYFEKNSFVRKFI